VLADIKSVGEERNVVQNVITDRTVPFGSNRGGERKGGCFEGGFSRKKHPKFGVFSVAPPRLRDREKIRRETLPLGEKIAKPRSRREG